MIRWVRSLVSNQHIIDDSAELNLGWDDPISDGMKVWIQIIQLLKDNETVRFPRCIKPKDTVGNLDLDLFQSIVVIH